MTITDLQDFLQIFEFKALVLALLIYVFYFSRNDSFTITLSLLLTTYLSHFLIEIFYQWSLDNGYLWQLIAYHAWYLGFALTDFLFMYLAYYVCKRKKFRMYKISEFIIFNFVVLGFIQLLRYADREVFETEVLDYFYTVAIPTIDGAMSLTICVYVVSAISMDFYKERAGG